MNYKHHLYCIVRCLVGVALLVVTGRAATGANQSLDLAWDANPEPDIAGYRIHYGVTSGNYKNMVEVGPSPIATVPDLNVGTAYFFVVTAFNTAGLESLPSNEISFTPEASPPSPFSTGNYTGAAVGSDGAVQALLTIRANRGGAFSGRIMIGNSSGAVRGKFAADGTATAKVAIPGQEHWILTLQLAPGERTVTVTATNSAGAIPLTLAWLPYSRSAPALAAGKYTGLLGKTVAASGAGLTPANEVPPGWGFMTLVVSGAGAVRATGRLPDNTPITIASWLNAEGHFFVNLPLYFKKGGNLSGNIALSDSAEDSDGNGTLSWIKPPQKGRGFYMEGFAASLPVRLSRFQNLKKTSGAAAPAPAVLTLSGGELSEANPVEHDLLLQFGTTLSVVNPAQDRLRLRLGVANGLISGSFFHPVDGRTRSVSGVLFQKTGTAGGFFPGQQTTGTLALDGLPTN